MVCTNCQSKEVIHVQNEYFCIDCGHTMADPMALAALEIDKTGLPNGVEILATNDSAAAPNDPMLIESQPIETPVLESIVESGGSILSPDVQSDKPLIEKHASPMMSEKPKKRKVGRPKAARLDVPVAAAIVLVPETPVVAEAPKIHKSPVAPKNAQTKSSVVDMSDLRTPKTGTAKVVAEDVEGLVAPVQQPLSKQQSIRTGDILAESWQGRFRLHHSLFALIPAVIIALISAGVAAAVLGPNSDELLEITKAAAIPVLGDLVIILALYYVCRSLATAAITFAAARSADHRKVPMNRWWGIAVNSFGGKLRFDLLMLTAEIGILFLIIGLVVAGGTSWPVNEYVQVMALYAAFIALLYVLSGLLLTQGFGRVSIVLGKNSSRQAFGIGWGFFRNHFDLVGAKLISLILELIIVVPLVGAVVATGWLVSGSDYWWFVLALTLAVALGGVLIGAGTAIWWESAYRQLVHKERISEAVALLTGRVAGRARRVPLVAVSMLIALLVIAATVWPWLPWPTLN